MSLGNDSHIQLGVSPFSQTFLQDHATDLMTSSCRVYTPNLGVGTYDRVTGRVTAGDPVIKYEGPCRIWEVPGGQQIIVGDEEITVTQTYLSLPYWITPLPENDDIIQVIESDDPDLVGRTLSVVSTVRGGGLRASRRFQVKISESKKATW